MTERLIRGLIERYGTEVTVYSDGALATTRASRVTRAFFRIVTSKSWQNMERMVTNAGEVPRGQYLYIGCADCPLQNTDMIMFDGRRFVVRRSERIFLGAEAVFVWALCVEGGAAA